MRYHVCKKRKASGNILRDDEVTLKTKSSKGDYPQRMRRIVALVEVDGKMVEMVFITNNMDWAASSVCDLYKSRWSIEGKRPTGVLLYIEKIHAILQVWNQSILKFV